MYVFLEILIYDVDFCCPGSFHDACVWRSIEKHYFSYSKVIFRFSAVKQYLEQRFPHYLLAGDSAYPRSLVLVTSYSRAEARDDESKRLFNLRYISI